MKTPWLKWPLVVFGTILVLLMGGFAFLVFDFRGHDQTRLIRESTSPDGHLVAEIHEVITPMHGGPDMVQVTLRPASRAVGDIIYSQTFECGPDYRAFQVEWQTAQNLTVSYGICDAGRYNSASDKKVFQKSASWEGINIIYKDSGYVAHAKL
jgi:hypothetical protein